MICKNGASVADAKYGSQQLARIYHGSDLIWENDEWVTFEFPSPGLLMTYLHKPLGFTITDNTDGKVPSAYKFFSNANNVYSGLTKRSTGQWTRINFVLPDELGEVRLLNFKAHRCTLLYGSHMHPDAVNLLYAPDALSASVSNSPTADEMLDGENGFVSFASAAVAANGNTNAIDAFFSNTYGSNLSPAPVVKTLRFCVRAPYWSTGGQKTVAGEKYNFKFLVRKSCLEAWEAAYDLPIENESQEDINV